MKRDGERDDPISIAITQRAVGLHIVFRETGSGRKRVANLSGPGIVAPDIGSPATRIGSV